MTKAALRALSALLILNAAPARRDMFEKLITPGVIQPGRFDVRCYVPGGANLKNYGYCYSLMREPGEIKKQE